MREWQVAQTGLARWRSICSRMVSTLPFCGAAFSGGTPGGGGLGGEFIR